MHACCYFYLVKRKVYLVKRKEAQDCFSLGNHEKKTDNHGNPKGYNQALHACMRFLPLRGSHACMSTHGKPKTYARTACMAP